MADQSLRLALSQIASDVSRCSGLALDKVKTLLPVKLKCPKCGKTLGETGPFVIGRKANQSFELRHHDCSPKDPCLVHPGDPPLEGFYKRIGISLVSS